MLLSLYVVLNQSARCLEGQVLPGPMDKFSQEKMVLIIPKALALTKPNQFMLPNGFCPNDKRTYAS